MTRAFSFRLESPTPSRQPVPTISSAGRSMASKLGPFRPFRSLAPLNHFGGAYFADDPTIGWTEDETPEIRLSAFQSHSLVPSRGGLHCSPLRHRRYLGPCAMRASGAAVA